MHANWFDSPCLLRQVLKCLNIKRAVSTFETTVITIEILVLDKVIADYPRVFDNEIVNLLKVAQESLDNSPESTLHGKILQASWWVGIERDYSDDHRKKKGKQNTSIFDGVRASCKEVIHFHWGSPFTWLGFVPSFEAMIKDFSSLDRIKFRRWSAVYLADMHHLKEGGSKSMASIRK